MQENASRKSQGEVCKWEGEKEGDEVKYFLDGGVEPVGAYC